MLPLQDADALSAIVLNVALTCAGNTQDHRDALLSGLSVTRTARAIVRAVKLQVEYGQWAREEREAREQGDAYQQMYEALRRCAKRINARAVRRWWARIASECATVHGLLQTRWHLARG
jgi:hypothetical protein